MYVQSPCRPFSIRWPGRIDSAREVCSTRSSSCPAPSAWRSGMTTTQAGIRSRRRRSRPRCGAGQTHAYSLEEVFAMLDVVPEPGRTMLAVGAFTALRRGEIRGLRWEDYRAGELHVERSVWNGISTDPKTEESKNAVPVIPKLAAFLVAHREQQANPVFGWMFPTATGTAADLNHVVQRVIGPALKLNGIPWHGWHALSRGLATTSIAWELLTRSSRGFSGIPTLPSLRPHTSSPRIRTAEPRWRSSRIL